MYDILLPNVGRIVGPGIECRKEGSFIRSVLPSGKLFSLFSRWIVVLNWMNCRVRYLSWCRMSDCENKMEIYTVKQTSRLFLTWNLKPALLALPERYNARNARWNARFNARCNPQSITHASSKRRVRENEPASEAFREIPCSLFSVRSVIIMTGKRKELNSFWPFGQQAVDILAKQNICWDTVLTELVFSTARN